MDLEEKLLYMFGAVHGELSCAVRVYYNDDVDDNEEGHCGDASGVAVVKGGCVCWSKTKEDILFDYVTRDMGDL